MPRLIRFIVLLTVVGLSACDVSVLGGGTDRPIQTSRLEYVLWETSNGDALEARIPYRFENQTDGTVCLTSCNGAYAIVLEKRVAGEWRGVWSPAVPECLSPPIIIEPSSSVRDTLHVFHGLRDDLFPKLMVDEIGGVYRLNTTAASRPSSQNQCQGTQLAERHRISNQFRLGRQ